MTEDLGTPTRPHALTGEQWRLEVRTDDPPSPSADERWIRSDLDSGDRIATLKCGDGTEIPLFATGSAEETVREARRYRVGGQTVYAPLAPVDEAAFPARRVQHDGQTHAFHDRVAPGSAIPDSGISRYKFEDDSDTSVLVDSWGNNDGSLVNGPVYVTGGVEFDGTDDYGEVPNATVPFGTGVFSVALRMSSSATGTDYQTHYGLRNSGTGHDIKIHHYNGTLRFQYFGASGVTETIDTGTDYRDGAEHLLTFVIDSNGSEGFVDGTSVGTAAADTFDFNGESPRVAGWGGSGGGGRESAMTAFDKRTYDKRLSATEVSNLYNNGSI